MPIKPALCFRGRKTCHAVINDDTRVRVVSDLSIKDHDRSAPVLFQHQKYPIQKFVETFLDIGKRKGITKRAQFMLAKALNGGIDEEAELPPDETEGTDEPPAKRTGAPTKPASASPSPKPAKPASKAANAAPGASGGTLVARIAAEYRLEPPKLRKLLRAKGLRAPYDGREDEIRKILGKK